MKTYVSLTALEISDETIGLDPLAAHMSEAYK